jgi:hypothetical protein
MADTIGVATLGVGARTRELLAQMFARTATPPCRLAEPAQAHVVLVDLDAAASADSWVQLRAAHPQLAAVVVCTDIQRVPDGLPSIAKPIDPVALMDALQHAGRQLPAEFACIETTQRFESRDVDTLCGLTGDKPADARFDPERHLQAVVAETARLVARARVVHTIALRHAPERCIVLHPDEGGRAAVLMTESLLHGLACATDVRQQLHVAAAPHLRATPNANDWMATESLIWMLALYAAHGRLPRKADTARRVRLWRWPNLTRLVETPGAMGIAACWATRALSIDEAVRVSGVTPRAVHAFYAACDALNLFEDAVSALAPKSLDARQPTARTGMFARLIGRLLGKEAA